MTLEEHIIKWKDCTRCQIGENATYHVFHRSNDLLPIQILFIGEAPGETERLPFVGRSGQLLDSWIKTSQEAYKLATSQRAASRGTMLLNGASEYSWAITNMIACRPVTFVGKNRPPLRLELINCHERLMEYIEWVNPKGIVLLGKIASEFVTKVKTLRLYHPSYILQYAQNLGPTQAQLLSDFVSREVK